MNTQTDPRIKAREILDNYLPLLGEQQIENLQNIVDGNDETVNWMEFHSIWAWVDLQERIQVALKKPVDHDAPNDPKGAAGALKSPLGLIPPVAMDQTAWVHKLGASKYGPYNWRATGVCATTYVNAILRHLNAWRDGEDLDPESGISHIAHVACSCNILMDAAACGRLQDDRNVVPQASKKEPAFGEDYRLLEAGELIQDGDEYYALALGNWYPTKFGGRMHSDGSENYRRKIEPEPEPEYYYLGHEDVIEKGDEFYDSFEDVWVKSSYIGRPAGKLITSVPYRRPIKQENVAEESDEHDQCECGRFLISHFLMGAICEDCDLQWQDPY